MNALKFIKGKLGYGVGAVGLDLSYGMFYSFLAKYLTYTLERNGVRNYNLFLLILTPIARLWDGINDPMMGTIVDNTHTKMGKYRPWILTGTCLNAIVLVFLFSNPFKLSGAGLCVYVAITYILWGMTNTLADIPYWSMIPSFTSDPKERNLISTVARAFSGLGQGIVTIGAPLLMTAFSRTTEFSIEKQADVKVYDERSFFFSALICSACLIVFALVCVGTTKERITTTQSEKFTLGRALQIVKSNDQLLIFMLFSMISNAGWYLTSGVAVYYFDVVVGNTKKQSAFSTASAIGSVVGMLLLPVLTKYMSKRRAYQVSLGVYLRFSKQGYEISVVGDSVQTARYAGMSVCAFSGNLVGLNIFYIIGAIGISSMFIAQTIFLADIVDYGEFKMGFRAESITFSMKGFLQKMAYTVQTIILFATNGLTGYSEELHMNNSAAVKNGITAMLCVIPVALFLISLVIFSTKFKLHGSFMDEVTKTVTENQKRRELAQDE